MAEDSRRRLPSIRRSIACITPEDIRVQLLGTVVDSQGTVLVLDDGQAKINITFAQPVKAAVGSLVRVYGRAVPTDSGFEVSGEILQDMAGLDLQLAKKVLELEQNILK